MSQIQLKILDRCIPEPNSGCWIWIKTVRGKPGNVYGVIYHAGKYYSAHRLAYEAFHSPIPTGLHVCHKCDNTYCVNPDHLFLGTVRDNSHDMRRKGRGHSNQGEKHTGWQGLRLTEKLVLEIRKSSVPTRQLARELGVSRYCISAARKGITWAYLKDIP